MAQPNPTQAALEWVEEYSPKPGGMDPGIVRYQYRQQIQMVAAELSKEIKHDLMQEMLTQRLWGKEVGFECVVNGPATVVFGPKKLSKYFRITATF